MNLEAFAQLFQQNFYTTIASVTYWVAHVCKIFKIQLFMKNESHKIHV